MNSYRMDVKLVENTTFTFHPDLFKINYDIAIDITWIAVYSIPYV